MRRFPARTLLLAAPLFVVASQAQAALFTTIVQGLGGEAKYGEAFTEQTHQIEQSSIALTDAEHVTTFRGEEATREAVLAHFEALAARMEENDRVALYLIGHGSFDGDTYKFNIPGPDLTAADLDDILSSLPENTHVVVNTSSTSGAMLDTLEGENRLLISATRNGNERNSTEFGTFFAEALANTDADTNKNNNVSIQEAFAYAERRTADFYTEAGKLATEHPQFRGDEAQANAFNIGTVVARQSTSDNPDIAALLERRDAIDNEIADLQLNRDDYTPSDYTAKLRDLIIESAEVAEELDALQEENAGDGN